MRQLQQRVCACFEFIWTALAPSKHGGRVMGEIRGLGQSPDDAGEARAAKTRTVKMRRTKNSQAPTMPCNSSGRWLGLFIQ